MTMTSSGPDNPIEPQAPQRSDESSYLDDLLPTVYAELQELAGAVLHRYRRVDATRTTSLIHDVYLRLAGRGIKFRDRAHFLGMAAKAMRSVLVDRARRAGAIKRGGGQVTAVLDDALAPANDGPNLLAVHEALLRLSEFDPRKARVVELRFFGGLSIDETAEATTLSPATVKRDWLVAKAWLLKELDEA